MGKIRKLALIFLLFSLLAALPLGASAQYELVNVFKGNVSIGGSSSASGGAVVEAFIDGASSAAESYTVGSLFEAPEYAVDFSCGAGSTAFLKVWGINASNHSCYNQQTNLTNLSVSLVANDAACSYANACSGGFCCSGSTAVNQSAGSGTCQAVACGAGITIPSFALSAASITTAQTINFTINISSVLRYNITAANFTLVTGSTVVSRNFTIPSNGRNFNVSYKIFDSAESASAGTYNITAIQVNDNGSITNRTLITNMNFTVTAAASTTTDTGGGGSSSGGGGGGGGTPTTTTPAAPSQATIDTVKESLPASFKAAGAVVEYSTVAAAEVKEVPVAADAVTTTLAQVETVLKTDAAKQALETIQQAISSGGATTLSVKKTVEVVKATNKGTGESVTVSVVKLSVTAPSNQALKNVEVIEVIPKAAASNVNQVTFLGEKPVVLEADPVVKWSFPEILQGQKKDFSYTVNADMSNLGTNTIGVSQKTEAAVQPPPQQPTTSAGGEVQTEPPVKSATPVSTYAFVVLIALVVVGGWLFLKSRKKPMQ